MIAYYEGRGPLPPGHVLEALAEALGLSVDMLLGKSEEPDKPQLSRALLERLSLVEQLPLKDKRELFGVIDTYLAKNQLKARRRVRDPKSRAV
jgi:hypothetical protein